VPRILLSKSAEETACRVGCALTAHHVTQRTLTALLLLTPSANANPLVIISDPGIYTFTRSVDHPNPATTSGLTQYPTSDPYLLQKTTHICAKLHSHFGLHLSLPPPATPSPIPVAIVFTHPPMTNHQGQSQIQDLVATEIRPNERHYAGWSFEDPTKLLPGRWHISILHNGQMIADQPFDIDFSCIQAIS